MKKAISILAILMVMALCLCACQQKNESIFGTWEGDINGVKTTLVLRDDGTGYHKSIGGFVNISFAYSLKEGQITFHELGDEAFGDDPFSYKIVGDKLTLIDGSNKAEFTKQK